MRELFRVERAGGPSGGAEQGNGAAPPSVHDYPGQSRDSDRKSSQPHDRGNRECKGVPMKLILARDSPVEFNNALHSDACAVRVLLICTV